MKPAENSLKVLNSISLPILLIDREYKIADINSAALLHLGKERGDVIGHPCFNVTHDLDHECWLDERIVCPVRKVFETNERVHAIHRHQIRNHVVVEDIVATPIRAGQDGEVEYVIEEFRDVTELLELREGILPICSSCKKVRGMNGDWSQVEEYIHDHTGADFSHSFCPDCLHQLYPDSDRKSKSARTTSRR